MRLPRTSFNLKNSCGQAGRRSLPRIGWRGLVWLGTFTALVSCLLFQSIAAENTGRDFSGWRTMEVPTDATNGLGTWIWSEHTSNKQICQFWRSFKVPSAVKQAKIRITADNGYRLFLDGRELGQGTEWRALTDYDVTQLLAPGAHTLGVVAFNDFLQAGMIFGLHVELMTGEKILIKSDADWRIVPEAEPGWETKTKAAPSWAHAKILAGEELPPMWWSDRPLDFVVVPPFKPIPIPFWHRLWVHVALISLCVLVFLTCILLIAQLIVQTKEQRLLQLERSRIARDIHDDVGTRLTKLVLQGEVAQSTLPVQSEERRQFDSICGGLREVLGAMDEVLWAVNPRHDTLLDFITHICDYAQSFLQHTNIRCLLDVEPDIPAVNFDLPLRRSLLLVVKEVLSNAAKYSQATRLQLKIHRSSQKLIIIIEDNGRGFDLEKARPERNGLRNIFQRTAEAEGECQIKTRPGAGCRVELSIPLARRSPGNWLLGRHFGQLNSKAAFPDNATPTRPVQSTPTRLES
ncbi:MAG: hypothetical protein H7Y43_03135 [Akkermansiaceae bacterium]|nr:hypothetical protein [Verrucomicrobiales bacterium]